MTSLITIYTHNTRHTISTLCAVIFLIMMCPLANANTPANIELDLSWESQYISQGRNNLDNGGIMWGIASVEKNGWAAFALVGRADQVHYTEWNAGLAYTFHVNENFDATLGYQRLAFYADEHASDNELFGSLTYTAISWFIPAVDYTYSTEAAGYFVEISAHSPWQLSQQVSIAPYIVQGFDFQYTSENYNGPNHLQLGIEVEYQLTNNLTLSGHISHTFAQEDIKREAQMNNNQNSLDETYSGIHFNWHF